MKVTMDKLTISFAYPSYREINLSLAEWIALKNFLNTVPLLNSPEKERKRNKKTRSGYFGEIKCEK